MLANRALLPFFLLSFALVGLRPSYAQMEASQYTRCDSNACCDAMPAYEPCCKLCPCAYGMVEGLIMDRNNSAINQPLIQDVNSQTTLFSTSNLNPDWGGGFRVLAGKRIVDCYAIEAGYFGLFGLTDNYSITSQDGMQLPGDLGLAVNNFFSANRVDIESTSYLQGAEANLVRCNCCCDPCRSIEWFTGFRYINFNDKLSITGYDLQESSSLYGVRAQNNLFGGQVGSRLRRCFGRFSVEGTGKAGLFGNMAKQSSDAIVDFPNFVVRPATSASDCQAAFVGDLNLSGIYQLNSVWGIRSGYNVMWLEGVALAPDQLDFTDTPTSGTSLANNGGVFLHGVNFGLEGRW